MEIIIKKEILISAIQSIGSITDKSNFKPILSNFILKTLDDQQGIDGLSCVEIQATDYEITIIGKFPAQIIQYGSICINAKRLYGFCKNLTEKEISIQSTEQMWIHVNSGASELKLPCIDVDLYPQILMEDLSNKFSTNTADLGKFISKTLFASQTNESRRNLMGICLSISNEETRWLTTDGHRIAQYTGNVESDPFESRFELIIPRKALLEVMKAVDLFQDPIEISFDDRTIQFRGSHFKISSRLIEGKFPNCDPIIPQDNDFSVSINRERLINALKITSLISNEKLKPVKMIISPEKLILESEKTEYGETRDEIEIQHSGTHKIGMNARYLLDVLYVLDSVEIIFEFKGPMSACVIKDPTDDNFLSVIMPLRIEW